MKLYFADIAAILAASERDSQIINDLSERLKRLATYFIDSQTCIKYLPVIGKASNTIYYCLTWMNNSKTLGEEFAQLDSVDVFSRTTPSWFLRVLYIMFHVFITPALPRQFKIVILPMHVLLFYGNGQYMDPVKRFLGIRMVQSGPRKPASPFHYCMIIATLLNALLDMRDYVKDTRSRSESIYNKSPHDCPLCKDKMDTATVCPCGHVYCWMCISEWTRRYPHCPLCRQDCPSKQLFSIAI